MEKEEEEGGWVGVGSGRGPIAHNWKMEDREQLFSSS